MKLLVRTLPGGEYSIEAEESSSVEELKNAVKSALSISTDVKLIHCDHILKTGSIIDAGLKDGDAIVALAKRKPLVNPAERPVANSSPTPDQIAQALGVPVSSLNGRTNSGMGQGTNNNVASSRIQLVRELYNAVTGPSGNGDNGQQLALIQPDPDALQMLMEMGFLEGRCRKALLLCRNNVQVAMEWLLEHSDDPSADVPLSRQQLEVLSVRPQRRTVTSDPEVDFV